MVETKEVAVGHNTRKSFARNADAMEMPNLIEVQIDSYKQFLDYGIRQALESLGKITSEFKKDFELTFTDFYLSDETKYSIDECKKREQSYSKALYFHYEFINKATGEIIRSKDKDDGKGVFVADLPIMTDYGTFIINGAERASVSQLVRSPGAYYSMTHDNVGKELYATQIIPGRGAWLEYNTDAGDIFYVRVDKKNKQKLPVTVFIKALSALTKTDEELKLTTKEEIIDFFGADERILASMTKEKDFSSSKDKDSAMNCEEALLAFYRALKPGEPPLLEPAEKHINGLLFDPYKYDLAKVGRYKYNKKLCLASRLDGHMISRPVIDEYGEVIAEPGVRADKELCRKIEQAGVRSVYVYRDGAEGSDVSDSESGADVDVKIVSNRTVEIDGYFPDFTADELFALGMTERVSYKALQKVLEESEGLSKEDQAAVIKSNISELVPNNITVEDIYASISYLCNTASRVGEYDDIDHLANRRIRCVGEQILERIKTGLAGVAKNVRDAFQNVSPDEAPKLPKIINTNKIKAEIKGYFGSDPLSQFMDQTNPLAELTNKRRISALGNGGLSRDRASFEVRDVHYSHYGRMCPIESPEGSNIGLISYLATFAKINKYGFIEAPYRKVIDGKVSNEIVYMTADVEDNYLIAQANEPLDKDGNFVNNYITCRSRSGFRDVSESQVDFMDVSPRMVFSVATGMIPFLEHDDANRALMGANMQRQAVPLLKTEAPFVGTGMEYKAAYDSGVCVIAKESGVVEKVDSSRINIRREDGELDIYDLVKFRRSNDSTCINQKPVVNKGDRVEKGDVIADGPAVHEGEISLGKNALIGFMTWEGYNYEDAVLLNERMVREDVYTSIHIAKYEAEARETVNGAENITRDIPNVSPSATANLDEDGIVYIGAEVHSNDILVGKVSPKPAQHDQSPEDKLLRNIFGDVSKDVKDTSLRLPHGSYGTVIDRDVYRRDSGNAKELNTGVTEIVRVYVAQKRKIQVGDKMAGRHGNKGVVSRILPSEDMPFLEDGTPLDIVLNPLGVPSRMNVGQVLEVTLGRACRELGWKIMTPIFDGATEADIVECLKEADAHAAANGNARIPEDGKVWLYDGRTGERFDNKITVGVMYFLKLHHLVDDKIHARSTGPYSLVTQQPLGGKAQFGGQRFGEMEVWALEAYGAAYTLQEMLTTKSDDIIGRRAAFNGIVEGDNIPACGLPESFKVLVSELQALGLEIKIKDKDGSYVELSQDTEYSEETGSQAFDENSSVEADGYNTYDVNVRVGAYGEVRENIAGVTDDSDDETIEDDNTEASDISDGESEDSSADLFCEKR